MTRRKHPVGYLRLAINLGARGPFIGGDEHEAASAAGFLCGASESLEELGESQKAASIAPSLGVAEEELELENGFALQTRRLRSL